MKAPKECPMCGEKEKWKYIDDAKKGFSGGKALAGGILLGPLGLVAGALGKKNIYIFVQVVAFNTNMINKQF